MATRRKARKASSSRAGVGAARKRRGAKKCRKVWCVYAGKSKKKTCHGNKTLAKKAAASRRQRGLKARLVQRCA